MHMLTAR